MSWIAWTAWSPGPVSRSPRPGTIVLDHAAGQGRRALSLVPDYHLCLVDAATIADDVSAAFAALEPTRPTTLISGPSATSDIELESS